MRSQGHETEKGAAPRDLCKSRAKSECASFHFAPWAPHPHTSPNFVAWSLV